MIDNNGYLKLIDFGTAVCIQNFSSTMTGTPHYISPEVLEGNFSEESFGRIIDMFGNDKLTNKKFSNTIKLPIELENLELPVDKFIFPKNESSRQATSK